MSSATTPANSAPAALHEKPSKVFRRRGFEPLRILAAVENTAGWALTPDAPWTPILRRAADLQPDWQSQAARARYFEQMLTAHFVTVATFVPTDLDTHIRHHVWAECTSEADLLELIDIVDTVASWSPTPVSGKVVRVGNAEIYGHRGEWHSVRAGALGAALRIGSSDLVRKLSADIDAILVLEANAFAECLRSSDIERTLKVATTLAHNDGDLSRVVEAWPGQTPDKAYWVARYARLGHGGPLAQTSGTVPNEATPMRAEIALLHAQAGDLNKALMAKDNHRYLPFRDPRGLRAGRELILPFGPFLEAWGETVARSTLLSEKQVGEVAQAALHGHERDPAGQAYLRALHGIEQGTAGGLGALADYLTAANRKLLQSGAVRDALRLSPGHFRERIRKNYERAVATFRKTP